MHFVGLSFVLIVFLCLIHESSFCGVGYYWRQFTGIFPEDAVIAGKDINNNKLYVGRAYLNGAGVIPTELKMREDVFYIIWGDIPKTTEFVEILCGFQDDFQWVSANSTDFHTILLDKEPIIGGYHEGRGFMHIGRIHLNGETKIGKVDSFRLGDALFFCIDRNISVQTATSYEVLVYERTFTLLQAN